MKWILMMILCLGLAGRGVELPGVVSEHPLVVSLMAEHYLHIRGEGRVEVAYGTAEAMLSLEDVLTEVQRAYGALLPPGEEPEFVITAEAAGVYRFVNRKGQHTRIEELLRASCEREGTDMVLYAAGRRGFGDFRSLTWIRVRPAADGTEACEWAVEVFAYPENRVSRFFARNLGVADRYFRRKTKEISALAAEIALYLVSG